MSRRVGEALAEADAWRGGCRMNSTGGTCGRRSACGPNEFGLQGPSANGRPAPTGEASLASAEADAWRVSASEGRFPIGVKAFGRRSAYVPNEAEADAWRVSALGGRFQSA